MSIEYMLVKEQKRKEAEKLSAILQRIGIHCKEELAAARGGLPEMADDIDSIEFELDAAIRRCTPGYYRENEIIGTSTATRFEWRMDNGFLDIKAVEEFLGEHPGYHIEDEYGTAIPLAEFRKTAQK